MSEASYPQRVMAILAANPEGMHASAIGELIGLITRRAAVTLNTLKDRQQVIGVIDPGPMANRRMRWFHVDHKEAAEAFKPAPVKCRSPKRWPTKGPRDARSQSVSPHWRNFEAMPEPRVTAETKVTIAPKPVDRFHITHAPSVINANECRTWAALITS